MNLTILFLSLVLQSSHADHVMGFSHDKTTHHFTLYADGGAIQVDANTAGDTESRDQIRGHLTHIAKMFTDGDFNAPFLVHEQTPPGVPVLQKLKEEIAYKYEKTPRGARIRVTTKSAEARDALYEFLRFQIREHKTGDSTEIRSKEASPRPKGE